MYHLAQVICIDNINALKTLKRYVSTAATTQLAGFEYHHATQPTPSQLDHAKDK
jgi:hypothetical protein